MSIPPFPSQDLAKLVLGYLAEEQLMTAYDEFLQASPYLDALRNEYDRIFMTSLKSILAEYRAVKICVDTCKPFALRKKIFQCTNLLEIVKFLIANVDIKKIQDTTEKPSIGKQNITTAPKSNTCELCHSLSLPNCVCKSRVETQKPQAYASNIEGSCLQNSVEATPLADLPGNHVTTQKKHINFVGKDSLPMNSSVSSLQNSAKQSFSSNISPEEYLAQCENSSSFKSTDATLCLTSTVKPVEQPKSNHNIEEFNDVLKSVVKRNKTLSTSENSSHQRISNVGTFQDFTSGVSNGENLSATYNVPDSSTSENSVRAPVRKDVYNDNIKGPPHGQLMLQVSHVNDAIEIKSHQSCTLPKLLPKNLEKQIKIISDIKVDNKLSDKRYGHNNKHPVFMNAASTPMMQMQTIMINGTPAYKHTPNIHTFTKDEIMAMPTLIVVPASGSSQVPMSAHDNSIMTSNNVISEADTSPRILGPLVIDVPANAAISNEPMEVLPDLSEQRHSSSDLVKTVDIKNSTSTTASVPKDNVVPSESNTPQVMPPKRKSSSTPRRSSHIRVLDFTTPRRILHETINEHVPSQTSSPPVEVVASSSRDKVNTNTDEADTMDIKSEDVIVVNEDDKIIDSGSTKENVTANNTKQVKKRDWDADLRALVANEKPVDIPHRKPKPKPSKKKKSSEKASDTKDSDTKKKSRSKKSPRVKKLMSRNEEELDDEIPPSMIKPCDAPVKPTIKIISGDKMINFQEGKPDIHSDKNKSHEKTDECNDTPETERLSLQNVIGAKFNISDFLETPYKQALYDIQMDTPRCLGPDLPGEPVSDIKITSIPTPRFLNTTQPQPTPSYPSRPTDYSSGGSYYKPDDQDYMPIPDLSICPVTSSKEDVSVKIPIDKDSDAKKLRPVRKCAKNVSYYNNFGAVKKDVEDNTDAMSSCSQSSANSSLEIKTKKETTNVKTPRTKTQSANKSDSKKKTSACKNRKSSKDSTVKEKTKSFMKIKPKYTPKKGTLTKNGKRALHSPRSRGFLSPQRKRTISKDKTGDAASAIIPAATKSRRKSSTPRKLHCTKTFNSEVCHVSPENIPNTEANVNTEKSVINTQDSDAEQIALHWSDEGSSEDAKQKYALSKSIPKDIEDITKIQEFIVSSGATCNRLNDGTLQRDLMKRGFDLETAKIIERDLLDEAHLRTGATTSRTLPIPIDIAETKKDNTSKDKTNEANTNEDQTAHDDSDDDFDLSVHECNEESNNYFVFKHDYTKEVSLQPPIKIKDNYTMEICIEDMTIRLKAPPFRLILDQDPLTVDEIDYSYKETKQAVASISGMDRLYTPLKDPFKTQCYEIFDSTLTSIDTPLKDPSHVKKSCDASVTELVLEIEKTESKDHTEANKRKRARSSSNESSNSSKRTKPDADLLLKAANIQNIDIETVLTKLHGH